MKVKKTTTQTQKCQVKANIVLEVLREGIIDEIARREGVAVHEIEK